MAEDADDPLAWIPEGAGSWRDRDDIGDGVEWQRRVREGGEPLAATLAASPKDDIQNRMGTSVQLPEEDIRWLDRHSRAGGLDRAALLREAMADLKAKHGDDDPHAWLKAGFGLWKDRDDIPDGVEYQRALRAEWDREWDVVSDAGE